MKKVNQYRSMMQKHQKEVNSLPIRFAFSQEQFATVLREWGLNAENPSDLEKIRKIPGGGFILAKDVPAMRAIFAKHRDERNNAIAADKSGTGFIYDMFLYELSNHEYGYTGDISETLEALHISDEDLNGNAGLQHGLDLACQRFMG